MKRASLIISLLFIMVNCSGQLEPMARHLDSSFYANFIDSLQSSLGYNKILPKKYKVPINAMAGLFGHEFSHVLDFQQRNFFGVWQRGFNYLAKKTKRKYEQETDFLTIEQGLGWQLYDWTCYVLYESDVSERYLKMKRKVYLSAEEIMEMIE